MDVREEQVRRELERIEYEEGTRRRQVEEAVQRLELAERLGERAWAARALVRAMRQASGEPGDPERWRHHSASARKVAEYVLDHPGEFEELHESALNYSALVQHVERALGELWSAGHVMADSRVGGRIYWWPLGWEP